MVCSSHHVELKTQFDSHFYGKAMSRLQIGDVGFIMAAPCIEN